MTKDEFIEKFKKIRYYGAEGELSDERARELGLLVNDYMTLDECAYQCAYDISNDWVKDNPTWDDVEEAYKRGALEAFYRLKENGEGTQNTENNKTEIENGTAQQGTTKR